MDSPRSLSIQHSQGLCPTHFSPTASYSGFSSAVIASIPHLHPGSHRRLNRSITLVATGSSPPSSRIHWSAVVGGPRCTLALSWGTFGGAFHLIDTIVTWTCASSSRKRSHSALSECERRPPGLPSDWGDLCGFVAPLLPCGALCGPMFPGFFSSLRRVGPSPRRGLPPPRRVSPNQPLPPPPHCHQVSYTPFRLSDVALSSANHRPTTYGATYDDVVRKPLYECSQYTTRISPKPNQRENSPPYKHTEGYSWLHIAFNSSRCFLPKNKSHGFPFFLGEPRPFPSCLLPQTLVFFVTSPSLAR